MNVYTHPKSYLFLLCKN